MEWEEGVVWRGYSGIVEKLEASGHNWIKLVEEDDIRQPTLGVLNGSIVAVGGLDKDTWSKKVRVLNVRERCWDSSLIPDMIVACSGACVVSSEGHLIVIGGFDGQKKLDLVQVYVAQIKRWFLGKSLPEACFSGSAVVQSGTSDIVYVIGGDGMANRVWSAKVKDLVSPRVHLYHLFMHRPDHKCANCFFFFLILCGSRMHHFLPECFTFIDLTYSFMENKLSIDIFVTLCRSQSNLLVLFGTKSLMYHTFVHQFVYAMM